MPLVKLHLIEEPTFIVDPFQIDFGIDTLAVFQVSFTGKM